MSEFSYELGESEKLAQKIMESYSGFPLGKWDQRMREYREHKAALIAALGPETGRSVLHIDKAVQTDQSAYDSFFHACESMGMARFAEHCRVDEAVADQVDKKGNSQLPYLCDKIKPGMKLGRAFVAYITSSTPFGGTFGTYSRKTWAQAILQRWHNNNILKGREDRNPTDKEFVDLLADELSRIRARGQKGTLILSANVLDILLMSMHASFKTCHRIQGEHQAGPQHYLYDGHTTVAYYYSESRPYEDADGIVMPYKTWRQLVHVDLKGQYASLMRQYPSPANSSTETNLIGMIAQAIAKYHNKVDDPEWAAGKYIKSNHVASPTSGATANDGLGGAYVDKTSLLGPMVRRTAAPLHDGFLLGKGVPCLGCDEKIRKTGILVCHDCHSKGMCLYCNMAYSRCGGRIDNSPDGRFYCANCFKKKYGTCIECARLSQKSICVAMPHGLVCRDCFSTKYYHCDFCSGNFQVGNKVATPEGHSACPSCFAVEYAPCARCAEPIRKNSESAQPLLGDPSTIHHTYHCNRCRKTINTQRRAEKIEAMKKAEAERAKQIMENPPPPSVPVPAPQPGPIPVTWKQAGIAWYYEPEATEVPPEEAGGPPIAIGASSMQPEDYSRYYVTPPPPPSPEDIRQAGEAYAEYMRLREQLQRVSADDTPPLVPVPPPAQAYPTIGEILRREQERHAAEERRVAEDDDNENFN